MVERQSHYIYEGPLKVHHLTQIKNLCEASLIRANNKKETFRSQKGSEFQFVFNEIKQLQEYLKKEVGRAMLRDLIDDASIYEDIHEKTQTLFQDFKTDFEQKTKQLNDQLKKMQADILKHKKSFVQKCKENKVLTDDFDHLEKLYQLQLDTFQSYINDETALTQQRLDSFNEDVKNIIENDKPRQRTPAAMPNISQQPEEEKQSVIQQSLLAQQQIQLCKEYALDDSAMPTFVCKSKNGAIFTGGQNKKIQKLHNNPTQSIDTDEYINGGMIINNLLYCIGTGNIKIIDCDTFKHNDTIQLQQEYQNYSSMIQISDNNLLCFQDNYGCESMISIISLDNNKMKISQKVDYFIWNVIQTETQDGIAIATKSGLIFYKLELKTTSSSFLVDKDEHLSGKDIFRVVQCSKDIFLLKISYSYELSIYDRKNKTILKEIDIKDKYVRSLQSLYLKQNQKSKRIILMKGDQTLNAIDTQDDYSITHIMGLQTDHYGGPYSLFQEINENGNVNILSTKNIYKTGESKVVEFLIDKKFIK